MKISCCATLLVLTVVQALAQPAVQRGKSGTFIAPLSSAIQLGTISASKELGVQLAGGKPTLPKSDIVPQFTVENISGPTSEVNTYRVRLSQNSQLLIGQKGDAAAVVDFGNRFRMRAATKSIANDASRLGSPPNQGYIVVGQDQSEGGRFAVWMFPHQAVATTFIPRYFGYSAEAVVGFPSGHAIAVGQGDGGALGVRFSPSGAVEWEGVYVHENNSRHIVRDAVAMPSADELLVVGASGDRNQLEPWIMALHVSTGKLLWSNTYVHERGSQNAAFTSVLLTQDSIYAAGNTLENGNTTIVVAKIGHAGNLVWSRRCGGLGRSLSHTISLGLEGDIVVGGSTTAKDNSKRGWLLALSNDGNVLWEGSPPNSGTLMAIKPTSRYYSLVSDGERPFIRAEPKASSVKLVWDHERSIVRSSPMSQQANWETAALTCITSQTDIEVAREATNTGNKNPSALIRDVRRR